MTSSASRRGAGELEAEALSALWAADRPLTSAEVREELGGDLAYTTVMTVLTRLHDKGLAIQQPQGRGYVYSPAVAQAELAAERMRALLEEGADRTAVLASFIGSLSSSDRRALGSLLARRSRKRS